MKFELSGRESKQLMRLVFLGNSILNNALDEESKNGGYNQLAQKLYRQYVLTQQNAAGTKKTDAKIQSLYDKLFVEMAEVILNYDDLSFNYKLAAILATKNYPFRTENKILLRESARTVTSAQRAYFEMLCGQGCNFVDFSAPHIDEAIQKIKDESNSHYPKAPFSKGKGGNLNPNDSETV